MAKKFLVGIDLNLNQILNAILQVLGTDPSSASGNVGRVWFNTADDRIKVQTATGIKGLAYEGEGGGDGGGDADTLNGQNGAYYLSRANHTGTQPASSISDFDTQVRSSRLDQMAAPAENLSLNNQRLVSVADPQNAQDAATKAYVDALAQGLNVKGSVRAASTANLTLSGTQTVDGVELVAGDRILVKNQTDKKQNGLYVVASGSWARAPDADTSEKVRPGMFTFVEEGATQADSGWVLSTDAPIVLDTTELEFAQFSGAGQIDAGAGLTKSGNTLNVGAGTGISVAADAVAIDTAVVVRKFASNVGDGVATAIVVQHDLNTRDVTVGVYAASGAYEEVEVDVEHTDENNVTLRFAVAPASNAYRVVIHG